MAVQWIDAGCAVASAAVMLLAFLLYIQKARRPLHALSAAMEGILTGGAGRKDLPRCGSDDLNRLAESIETIVGRQVGLVGKITTSRRRHSGGRKGPA